MSEKCTVCGEVKTSKCPRHCINLEQKQFQTYMKLLSEGKSKDEAIQTSGYKSKGIRKMKDRKKEHHVPPAKIGFRKGA